MMQEDLGQEETVGFPEECPQDWGEKTAIWCFGISWISEMSDIESRQGHEAFGDPGLSKIPTSAVTHGNGHVITQRTLTSGKNK
jgi:hypothetical protein